MDKNPFFPEISGRFGFGCMRLPEKDGKIDKEKFTEMVDTFLASGLNYFDTAHGYHGGNSETALRECLTSRYSRDRYVLTDKLSTSFFNTTEEIRPYFEKQLEACGVDYFDFYLMHAQDKPTYEKYTRLGAYETAYSFKAEGKIKHFGISFHDSAALLEQILTEHPEIEIVQIQMNYIDYEDSSVDSRGVYEVCEKFGKPTIAMEPVKGGNLCRLPEVADRYLAALPDSRASYALRFAADFPFSCMVISGMSNMEQLEDNLKHMTDIKPLTKEERNAVKKACDAFKSLNIIPCTSCRYCVNDNECPADILIPDVFSAYNSYGVFKNWNAKYYYNNSLTSKNGKASDCIECGMCESVCPQHLEIRSLLKDVAKTFGE